MRNEDSKGPRHGEERRRGTIAGTTLTTASSAVKRAPTREKTNTTAPKKTIRGRGSPGGGAGSMTKAPHKESEARKGVQKAAGGAQGPKGAHEELRKEEKTGEVERRPSATASQEGRGQERTDASKDARRIRNRARRRRREREGRHAYRPESRARGGQIGAGTHSEGPPARTAAVTAETQKDIPRGNRTEAGRGKERPRTAPRKRATARAPEKVGKHGRDRKPISR